MTLAQPKSEDAMHYVCKTPNGICSYYIIKIKNIVKIFGILITKTKRVLFFHQRKNNLHQKTIIVIKNCRTQIALYSK